MADRDFFKAFSSKSQRSSASPSAGNGSVTPQRRPRVIEDVDGTDDDISIDENGSIRSHSSKRRRLESDEDDDFALPARPERAVAPPVDSHEDVAFQSPPALNNRDDEGPSDVSEPPSENPVLPDSFRRSPRQSRNSVSNAEPPRKHLPGSIVRVALTNFVTYTKAEFHPGPNLNMIIGPNGTGKSTLVCAICLGLGWKPDHLGRAKDPGEFVKHGEKVAYIEIELARNPERDANNPIVKTKITKEGNKTDFAIDGKKVKRKELSDLMNSFSIQVDNLCQFLPQDRVVEFAAQSPEALLISTQKAAAPPYMSQWHEELKSLRKSQKEKQATQEELIARLKGKEDRQRAQQHDIDQIRQRAEFQQRYDALQRFQPYNEYADLQASFAEAKKRKITARTRLRELQESAAPSLEAIREKAHYSAAIEAHVTALTSQLPNSQRRVKAMLDAEETARAEIAEKVQEIKDAGIRNQKLREDLRKLGNDLRQIQHNLAHPPEQIDFAEMNVQIQAMTRTERELQAKKKEITDEQASIAVQLQQRSQMIESLIAKEARSQTQIGQQETKVRNISADTIKGWDWVQKNRNQFEGQVFGPPAIECSVKDPRHAAAVETMLAKADKLAFTVTSRADFDKLNHVLYKVLNLSDIRIRQSSLPLDSFRPNLTTDELRSLGLESFLLDLMEGPDPVLAVLCDNANIHQIGFTSGDLTESQYNRLQNSRMGAWVTSKESCRITRRPEYGADAVSVRSNALRRPEFFNHAQAGSQDDGNTTREKNRLSDEMRDLEDSNKQLQVQLREVDAQYKKTNRELEEKKAEKRRLQDNLARFNGLTPKKEALEIKISTIKGSLAEAGKIREARHDDIDQLVLAKAVNASKIPNAVEAVRRVHQNLFEAQIMLIEARSEQEQLQERHAQELQAIKDHQKAVEDHTRALNDLRDRGQALQSKIWGIGEPSDFSEFEGAIINEIKAMSVQAFENEVEAMQAQLEMNSGSGNRRLLEEYERREKEIADGRLKLADTEKKIEELGSQINDIRSQWEPELDRLVEQISAAFSENFAKIHCVGEVGLGKEDDFDQWSIQIKVKFRENESLAQLDNHRQSGGERAVSTIFYLMSLQALARAPFRVVDEINQGMDPRNERMVHSRMVDIACGENSASQYFLITPKLLSGLRYHPSMKVHCIASGEHMPHEHGRLDFDALAQKALEVKGLA